MTKLTKREKFAILRTVIEAYGGDNTDMLIDFIDHEVDLLSRKNKGERKPTANQIANEELKNSILSEMEYNKLYSCSDIIKNLPCCEGLTPQKVSPLMTRLTDEGKVVRVVEKRRSYFTLA